MAVTGRLTTQQRDAINAGAAIRQTWVLYVPVNSTHTAYDTVDLDAGIFPMTADPDRRVIRAGSRKHQVWNPSPQVAIQPKSVRYTFVVSNEDKKFYVSTPGNFFYVDVASFQAAPQECRVLHQIFVLIPTGVPGWSVWSEITHMAYFGQITELRHEDGADSDGNPLGVHTNITCEQIGAWTALRRIWNSDDATDHPMTQTNVGLPFDYVWTVT